MGLKKLFKCLKLKKVGRNKTDEDLKAWEKATNGDVPNNAFVGGRDGNDENIYVIRAEHEDKIVVGTLKSGDKAAVIAVGGDIIKKTNYEVFCAGGRWMSIELAQDSIPSDAISGGMDEKKHPMYIGRVKKKYDHFIGNIDAATKVLNISIGQNAKELRTGEILITNTK